MRRLMCCSISNAGYSASSGSVSIAGSAVAISRSVRPVSMWTPRVSAADRLVIDDLGYRDDGITHVTARFGYMDVPDVPEVVRLLETAEIECPIEVDTAWSSAVEAVPPRLMFATAGWPAASRQPMW